MGRLYPAVSPTLPDGGHPATENFIRSGGSRAVYPLSLSARRAEAEIPILARTHERPLEGPPVAVHCTFVGPLSHGSPLCLRSFLRIPAAAGGDRRATPVLGLLTLLSPLRRYFPRCAFPPPQFRSERARIRLRACLSRRRPLSGTPWPYQGVQTCCPEERTRRPAAIAWAGN